MERVSRAKGFTLLELMIVVAIIGILATTAIAGFRGYQLRTKFSEGKTNLSSIRTVQNAYFAERSAFVPAIHSPGLPGHPNARPQNWMAVRDHFNQTAGVGFDQLGWAPEGAPYFDYRSITNAPQNTHFTIAAIGDTDGDGAHSVVMYVRPDANGNHLDCTDCGGPTVPWDPTDCSIVFDEVAQVLPHAGSCSYPVADDF